MPRFKRRAPLPIKRLAPLPSHHRPITPLSKQPRLGPYSRSIDRGALGTLISGRSREGRFLRAYEAMLIDHVGGDPSAVQRALIARTARLALHLELMDQRAFKEGREFGPTDHHFYIAWANAFARHLARLGLEPPGDGQPSVEQVLFDIARRGGLRGSARGRP